MTKTAILECARQGLIRAVQQGPFGEIDLELKDEDYEAQVERVLFALEVNPGMETRGTRAQKNDSAVEPEAPADPPPVDPPSGTPTVEPA